MTKIIFFGTHDFGAGILESLLNSQQYEVVAVVTQPDRPVGRKHEVQKPAVKILAEKFNIQLFQPESLKNFKSEIENLKPDLAIVCQYGLIIPKNTLDLVPHNFINIHTSLLPKYRGASPIQSALVNGETETGVTIMLMDEKMDHGAILTQEKIAIDPDDTYTSLGKKMLPVAQRLLLETLPHHLNHEIRPQIQNEVEATFCKMFTREDGHIDWDRPATEIYNRYRGLIPWPGVWTTWNGKRLKLLSIRTSDRTLPAGTIAVENCKIFVGAGKDSIEILELQLEGAKSMDSKSFIAGRLEFDKSKLET